jgi:hypothetical protein
MAGLKGRGIPGRLFFAAAVAAALAGCTATLDIRNQVALQVNPPAPPAPTEWTGVKTIVSTPASAAAVAVNGDIVYVLYYDNGAGKLKIIKSSDRAVTWGSPFTVDNTSGVYSRGNSMAVDANNLYIVYNRGPSAEYFIQLTDTGSTFVTSNGQKISNIPAYANGYENSICYDTGNVYIVYAAGGGPAFTYSPKGASMSFPVSGTNNVLIDTALGYNDGNSKLSSCFVDSTGNVDVSYFDDFSAQTGLKLASITPGSALPMAVSPIQVLGPAYIPAADYPSIGYFGGQWHFVSYYDSANRNLSCWEGFTYSTLLLHIVNVSVVVDNSSTNTGLYSKCLYIGSRVNIAYYDATNKAVRFAKGVMNGTTHQLDYTTSTVGRVGGTSMGISFAANGDALYIVYPDLTIAGGLAGGLKIAKSLNGGVSW